MSKKQAPYDAGQQPDRLAEIRARLEAVPETKLRLKDDFGNANQLFIKASGKVITDFFINEDHAEEWAALFTHAPADIAYLLAEVKQLQSLLETEQRAKWAAEQDAQHWQEAVEGSRALIRDIRHFVDHSLHDGYGCPFCKDASGHYERGEYWHDDGCLYERLVPRLEVATGLGEGER